MTEDPQINLIDIDYAALLGDRKVDHIITHCSATKPSQDIGAAEIDQMHRARGWLGCGYHIVIRRDGKAEMHSTGHKTRPLHRSGAHVGDCGPGWNARSIGICLIGGVSEDEMQGKHPKPENNFTPEQFQTLRQIIEDLSVLNCTTMGHRDLIKITNAPPKACPCFDVASFLYGADLDETDFPRNPQRPSTLCPKKHEVTEGDTLWGLSKTYGVTVETLMRLNNLEDSVIHPGQVLSVYEFN